MPNSLDDRTLAFEKALGFFKPISKSEFSALDASSDGKSIVSSDSNGLISVVVTEEIVAPELQKELDEQKDNLLNLCGLGVTYVKQQADDRKDPNTVYDTNLWQDVFNHLPLMSASSFARSTFQQQMKGVEIATKFLEVIFEAIVTEGASLVAFGTFLQSLGNSIRAGVNSGTRSYSAGNIGIVLDTVKVGNRTELVPKIKGYFIDFTQEQKQWYSSCATHTEFNVSFSYRSAVSVFNHRALNDPDVKKQFDSLIKNSQIADIKNADNFYNGKFSKRK